MPDPSTQSDTVAFFALHSMARFARTQAAVAESLRSHQPGRSSSDTTNSVDCMPTE